MKIVLFYGLRRSGNHGILHLFKKAYPNYVHMNDIELNYILFLNNKNKKISNRDIDRNYIGFSECDIVIMSMENKIPDINEINKFKNEQNEQNLYIFILLRNPIYNFGSAYKYHLENKNYGYNKIVEIQKKWLIFADIFLENNPIYNYIIYDMFYTNQEYMIKILDKMNIKFESIKDELENFSKWGISSYKKKENSRKMSLKIELDIFQNQIQFTQLLNDEIKNKWNNIINGII
jgi:hypothetical protein